MDVHQRFEQRLHALARRAFPAGVHHVTLAQVAALGHGDLEAGEAVLHKMFTMAGPRAIHPSALRELGNGNAVSGRKVIEKFLDRLHSDADRPEGDNTDGGKAGYFYERVPLAKIIPQPDGNHGRRYAKGGGIKITKAGAGYQDCGDSGRICAICSMYRDENKCTLVSGFISRTGTCKHFEKP